MATNFFDFMKETEETGTGLLSTGLPLIPIAGGLYAGFQRLKANEPVNASSILEHGRLGTIGKLTGQGLRQEHQAKLTEKLMSADAVQELLRTQRGQVAVVQSLLSTVDDPAFGFDANALASHREKLLSIVDGRMGEEDMRKLVGTLVNQIQESSDEYAKRRWGMRLGEFQKLGNHLVAPNFNFSPGRVFNPVDAGSLRGLAGKRYSTLSKMLGHADIRVAEVEVAPGQRGLYARVFSDAGPTAQHLTTIPLQAYTGIRRPDVIRVAAGENFQTRYRAPQYYIDAEKAEHALDRYGRNKVGLTELGKRGAIVDMEDYFIQNLRNYIDTSGGRTRLSRADKFNAFMVETFEADNRLIGLKGLQQFEEYGPHLDRTAKFQQDTVTIFNVQKVPAHRRDQLLTGLVSGAHVQNGRLDPGVGSDRLAGSSISDYGADGKPSTRLYHTLAVRSQHAMSFVRTGGKSDRRSLPVTARVEQIVGREAHFFARGKTRSLGRGGAFAAGAGGAPIEWSQALTGATNKAVLLDVGSMEGQMGRIGEATAGQGQAYGIHVGSARTQFTMPVLDPNSHKQLSTNLLNDVMSLKQGEFKFFSTAELAKHDHFIGMGPQGSRYLPRDPRSGGMWLGWQMMNDAHKKNTLHLVGVVERDLETAKLFGTLHKGTVMDVTYNKMMDELGQYFGGDKGSRGAAARFLRRNNIPVSELIVTAGDMLKKAPDYLHVQMISGAGLVTGKKDIFDIVESQSYRTTDLGNSKTARVTQTVIEQLGSVTRNIAGAEDAGRVLAAIYVGGTKTKGGTARLFGDQFADFAIDRNAFEQAVGQAFGAQFKDTVLQTARKGLALGASSFSLGTGAGDYHQGRGAVEPRFLEMLQGRLMNMGLSNNDISEFMVGIYKNKINYGESLDLTKQLRYMAESMLSMETPLTQLKDAQRIGVQELPGILAANGGKMSTYLEGQKGGVLLDLSSLNTVDGAAIQAGAKRVFGGQTQVFLPGSEATSAMRGTTIKMAGKNLDIGGQYSRFVDNFANDLLHLSTAQGAAEATAQNVFRQFKDDTMDLFANSFYRLTSGKIKGSAMQVSGGYDVRTGAFLSERQHGLLKGITRKTRGAAVFVDSKGFLSMLSDFMGEGADKSGMLESFFGSQERGNLNSAIRGARGLVSVTARHPMLSIGNVSMTQIFRDVREIGLRGGQDWAWKRLTESGVAGDAIAALRTSMGPEGQGLDIQGFGDVQKVSQKTARTAFWKVLGDNLEKWAGFEGGGRVFLPKMDYNVHFTNALTERVDFGIAGAAIGDHDGDQWTMFLTSKKMGHKIMSTMETGRAKEYLAQDALYKIQGTLYAEEAKRGIRAQLQASGMHTDEIEQAMQDLLKEKASKASVGGLDVKLNMMKRAALENAEANPRLAHESLAMLKMLQEHAVIKGKKLATFRPWAEMLVAGVNELDSGRGIGEFKRVLQTEIFPDSELWSQQGIGVKSIDGPEWAHTGVNGKVAQLDSVLDFLQSSFDRFSSSGGRQRASSGGMLAAAFKSEMAPAALRDLAWAESASAQSGMLSGWVGDQARQAMAVAEGAFDRVVAAAGKMDRRLLGPIAAGFGGAMVIAGLTGYSGYDRKPMSMHGESASLGVQSAMNTGSLFDYVNRGPEPAALQSSSDPYMMQGRPINMGQTLVGGANSYQIQGQVPGTPAESSVSYLQALSRGGGSIRINDTRRPITSAYIDRMTGYY